MTLSRRPFRTGPAGLACLQTPLGPVSELALGRWVRKRSTAHALPSLSKPKFLAIPTSPALLLVFPFLWVFALCGKQVFLCGNHFFCTGVSWGFQGALFGASFRFFLSSIYASGSGRHLLGRQGAAPQLLSPGWESLLGGDSSSLAALNGGPSSTWRIDVPEAAQY